MVKVIGGAIPANELKKLNSAGYQTLADTPSKNRRLVIRQRHQ